MKIATAWSIISDTEVAIAAAYDQLIKRLGDTPNLLLLYGSVPYDWERALVLLGTLAPGVPVHGGTSCLGIMTEEGFHSHQGVGMGLFGIIDTMGSYGVSAVSAGTDARAAATQATQHALKQAGREGEIPAMAWITTVPGHEEQVIKGIEDVLGSNVPITGGSSGDNTVTGEWSQFANGRVYRDAVVVMVMFLGTEVQSAFHSGYEPTHHKGRVTRATGRTLYEIDGRPAAGVYNEWIGGALIDVLQSGGNILARTSLHPLGRVVGTAGGFPYFMLAHPDQMTAEGALTLFANVVAGDELVLMEGTPASLVSRAGRVAATALQNREAQPKKIAGALVIYCAGCMLTVQPQMEEVVDGLRQVLGDAPILGAFTFGEQGCFAGGENRHGNLMISVLVFYGE